MPNFEDKKRYPYGSCTVHARQDIGSLASYTLDGRLVNVEVPSVGHKSYVRAADEQLTKKQRTPSVRNDCTANAQRFFQYVVDRLKILNMLNHFLASAHPRRITSEYNVWETCHERMKNVHERPGKFPKRWAHVTSIR